MKLKTRLVIGFVTVIILPFLLSVAVIWAFGEYQLHTIEKNYGIAEASYENFANPVSTLNKVSEKALYELKQQVLQNPKKLTDTDYLDTVNSNLENKNSHLIIRIDEDIVYSGRGTDSAVLAELPRYGDSDSDSENGIYIGGELQVLVKQLDFVYHGESKGSAFIVTDVSDVIPEVRKLASHIIWSIFIILVLTAGILILWIYRGVVIPLGRMKIATQNIKDGNLDFELEIEADDEIGQLCRDFEEMRLRLRDTADKGIESDRRNKELISNISHDLKTPITAIKGYVEGIMDGVTDTPEKMERYIKTIYNKANEMDLLINELTLYSKIDANRIPYNFNTVSVNDYFNDCAEDLKMELEAHGIEFEYENHVDKNVKIIADVEQLKRVINNIVSNSEKYMDKANKKVSLRVKDEGDFVRIDIEDNGKGIGAKELPNIFDRFYRTDESRNSSTGGSGIGLSIVKKIIEEHGGNIWASSQEDVGTVMHFVIRKYQEVPINE